jgi:hypothetical protein
MNDVNDKAANPTKHIVDEEIQELAGEIVRYLKHHPQAADTVEGITKWWIWRQRISDLVGKVQLALDYLVKQEVLITRKAAGNVVYTCAATDIQNSDEKQE